MTDTIATTSTEDILSTVEKVNNAFHVERKTSSIAFRKRQLRALKKMLQTETKALVDALRQDLHQTLFLAKLSEIDGVIADIDNALKNLYTWATPSAKSLPVTLQPGSGHIHQEAYGVVLLISPWNYPVRLCLLPLVGAIAAGNCVVIKPSEVAQACSNFLAKYLPQYLDSSCYAVIEGGIDASTTLLAQRWDYIFYTGSTNVGKIVMQAAAKHLTPVTLELGGKSPVIIANDANLRVAAKRIAWGKFSNVGQTCVAPDYILIDKRIKDKFISTFISVIEEFFGKDAKKSKDYTRIINQKHTKRLLDLLENQDIVYGGNVEVENKYVSPTIVNCPAADSDIMQNEIFGPILPVVPVDCVEDAIQFVRKREKPLALYVFTENSSIADHVAKQTSSGSVCVNDVIVQIIVPDLPFGGVGNSGMGVYNGKFSFDTFSHAKTVVSKATWADPSLRYPPYTDSKIWWYGQLSNPLGGYLPTVAIATAATAALSIAYVNRNSIAKLFS